MSKVLASTDPEGVFTLSIGDKNSALWVRFCEYLERRLSDLRRRNDHVTNSEQDTAFIRGRIAEIRTLIALGEEEQKHE